MLAYVREITGHDNPESSLNRASIPGSKLLFMARVSMLWGLEEVDSRTAEAVGFDGLYL